MCNGYDRRKCNWWTQFQILDEFFGALFHVTALDKGMKATFLPIAVLAVMLEIYYEKKMFFFFLNLNV